MFIAVLSSRSRMERDTSERLSFVRNQRSFITRCCRLTHPFSRRLEERIRTGFSGGMSAGKAQLPDGYLSRTPKCVRRLTIGQRWILEPISSFNFTCGQRQIEEIKRRRPYLPNNRRRFILTRWSCVKSIEIPAGSRDYPIQKDYVLPVDAKALSIYPHAHYLAKAMKVKAAFPDGTQRFLLHIKNWDFDWQDEYRFAEPMLLPKGTKISFRYLYDNSADNVRNPHNPPRRVVYGQDSTDEMAELMLQVVPRAADDLEALRRHSSRLAVWEDIEVHEKLLKANPDDAAEHRYLGVRYQQIGKVENAVVQFREALQIEPNSGRTHFLLGEALAESGRFDDALGHFREADRLEPDQPETLNSLAHVLARHPAPEARDPAQAMRLATRAVELTGRNNPAMWETLAMACRGPT